MSTHVSATDKQIQRFLMLIRLLLAYLVFVIIYGAVVRATGSGAGCGSSWPLCQGTLIPLAPKIKTLIEYGHRVTSGLSLPFILWVLFQARLLFAPHHPVRKFLKLTTFFLIVEALIGAFLVKFEHVADNVSLYRAFSMSFHLLNTFALTASCLLAIFSVRKKSLNAVLFPDLFLFFGAVSLVITGVSGAVTALGDTLFPLQGDKSAWSLALESSSHLFMKLRIFHPFIAIMSSLYVLYIGVVKASERATCKGTGRLLAGAVLIQIFLGYLNVTLAAPVWLQVVHLMWAQATWLCYIWLVASWQKAGSKAISFQQEISFSTPVK